MAGTTNMRKPPFASAETLFRFVFHRNFFSLSLSYFSHSQCWRGKSATIVARLNIASLKHDELWAIQKVTHQIRQFLKFTFFTHCFLRISSLRAIFWFSCRSPSQCDWSALLSRRQCFVKASIQSLLIQRWICNFLSSRQPSWSFVLFIGLPNYYSSVCQTCIGCQKKYAR